MDRTPILSVRDLDVKFNLRGRKLHAIRGVSLDLYKGESLAIVGESGSGKSVFVKTFMGLPSTSMVTSYTPMASSLRASSPLRTWPSSNRISPVVGSATG